MAGGNHAVSRKRPRECCRWRQLVNTPRTTPDIPLADELAGVFARMSGLLLSEDTVATSLDLLGALAHETVPGSCGAGVSLIEAGRRTSAGSTDERVQQADSLQYELD